MFETPLSTVLSIGTILMMIGAIVMYLAVLPIIRPRRRDYEPMEFTEIRKTTIYSDHIEKGEN